MNHTATLAIEDCENELIALSRKLWAAPETAFNEVNASAWTAELLRRHGFAVEQGCAGVPTAIRAVWGSGHPVIGFLGEYDALPGMSQKVSTKEAPLSPGAPGHGCGHNLLATACIGAALGLQAALKESGLPGTVVFYGCPAEEVLTGKVFMARGGAFRDLDLALAWHGSTRNMVPIGVATGLNSAIFHFKGVSAHAGSFPQNGRSALDAVELMNVGANYLREHVTSDVRIHYVITDGGNAPNIVPDKASVWYYVRAMSREAVNSTYDRLVKCAEGAAHMTETKMDIEFLGGCYNSLSNHVIADVLYETMNEIPGPQWTQEELEFADALNHESANYQQLKASGAFDGGPIHSSAIPPFDQKNSGSTDLGDVGHIVPMAMLMTATANLAAVVHSWQFTACSGHSIGEKGMLYGAKILASTAMKFMVDKDLLQKAKKEFQEEMRERAYLCPIPDSTPIPVPNISE